MDQQRIDIYSSINRKIKRVELIHKIRTQFSLSFIKVPKQCFGEVTPPDDLVEDPFLDPEYQESTCSKTASDLNRNSDQMQIKKFQHYLKDEDQPMNEYFSLNFDKTNFDSLQNNLEATETIVDQFFHIEEKYNNMPTGYTDRNHWKQISWNSVLSEEQLVEMSSQGASPNVRITDNLTKFQGQVANSGYNQYDEACLICGSKTGKHIHYGGHSCYSWCSFHHHF